MSLALIHRAALVAPIALAVSQTASAAEFDFENPPYIAGQTIVGQDGWITPDYVFGDPFFGGTTNGNVNIATGSPLSGMQSAFYEQTSVPAGAGGTGASDVAQADVITVIADGTDAADLTGSLLIQADANSIGNGQSGFLIGPGGGMSPVFVILNNANSAAGTGDILVGENDRIGTPVLSNVGAYDADDVLEFSFDVDIDNSSYDLFVRNVTDGTSATQLQGMGPNSSFKFFGAPIEPDEEGGQAYTLDLGLVFRSGISRVDSVTLVPEPATLGASLLALGGLTLRPRRSRHQI